MRSKQLHFFLIPVTLLYTTMHTHRSSLLPVDLTLTPINAAERGYRWVTNLIYDPALALPGSLVNNFVSLLHDGYKLGCAHHPISTEEKGLYEPISTTAPHD